MAMTGIGDDGRRLKLALWQARLYLEGTVHAPSLGALLLFSCCGNGSSHVFIKSCLLGTPCAPSSQNTKPSIAGGIIREQKKREEEKKEKELQGSAD